MTATIPGAAELGSTVSRLLDVGVGEPDGFAALCGLALRDNPRRAHLVVSRVLGKHVPAAPADVLAAGHAVGDAVADVLGGQVPGLVVGYCETATGLGHAAAARLGAPALSTTRRVHPGVPVTAAFEEEHSHAVAHALWAELISRRAAVYGVVADEAALVDLLAAGQRRLAEVFAGGEVRQA